MATTIHRFAYARERGASIAGSQQSRRVRGGDRIRRGLQHLRCCGAAAAATAISAAATSAPVVSICAPIPFVALCAGI